METKRYVVFTIVPGYLQGALPFIELQGLCKTLWTPVNEKDCAAQSQSTNSGGKVWGSNQRSLTLDFNGAPKSSAC